MIGSLAGNICNGEYLSDVEVDRSHFFMSRRRFGSEAGKQTGKGIRSIERGHGLCICLRLLRQLYALSACTRIC